LAGQIETGYPSPHIADGTVASEGHDQNNPDSDHRPDPDQGPGIVRALDCGVESMAQGMAMLEPIRESRDTRLLYVIFNNAIFSSYEARGIAPFTWRDYSGANPHKSHWHMSTLEAADSVTNSWKLGLDGGSSMANHITVAEWQDICNVAGVTDFDGRVLVVDDEYGPRTKSAIVKGLTPGAAGPGQLAISTAMVEVVKEVTLVQ
jgi:hypothetical protein